MHAVASRVFCSIYRFRSSRVRARFTFTVNIGANSVNKMTRAFVFSASKMRNIPSLSLSLLLFRFMRLFLAGYRDIGYLPVSRPVAFSHG